MIIGHHLALLLFPYMVFVVPLRRLSVARVRGDNALMARWCSFFLCTLLFVLPVFWALPTYFPLRYDVVWCMLACLSVCDAAPSERLVAGYIQPQIAQLNTLSSIAAVVLHPPVAVTYDESNSESSDDEKSD